VLWRARAAATHQAVQQSATAALLRRRGCSRFCLFRFRAALEHLVSGFAIHCFFIMSGHQGIGDDLLPLAVGERTDLCTRRHDEGALDDSGTTFFIEQRDQRFAHAEFGNGGLFVQRRIVAHGLGGGAHRFLVAYREGAQGMLDAIAELAENLVRHVRRVLCDEIHTHAFGADQAHHLFHLVQ